MKLREVKNVLRTDKSQNRQAIGQTSHRTDKSYDRQVIGQ